MARAFKDEVIISFIRSGNKKLKGRSLFIATFNIFIFFIISGNISSLEILLKFELLSVFLNN
jgi:hypothetical protein